MKKIFLHTTFFNKDFSLDIVQKAIKVFTVVWREACLSFFYVGLCSFFYVM